MSGGNVVKNLRFVDGEDSYVSKVGESKVDGSVYEHSADDVRIDIPRGFDETGHRKVLRKRTRNMQYTRKISSKVHRQRDIVWQVSEQEC